MDCALRRKYASPFPTVPSPVILDEWELSRRKIEQQFGCPRRLRLCDSGRWRDPYGRSRVTRLTLALTWLRRVIWRRHIRRSGPTYCPCYVTVLVCISFTRWDMYAYSDAGSYFHNSSTWCLHIVPKTVWDVEDAHKHTQLSQVMPSNMSSSWCLTYRVDKKHVLV